MARRKYQIPHAEACTTNVARHARALLFLCLRCRDRSVGAQSL